MITQNAASAIPAGAKDCTPAARVTKSLLGYGVLAGVVVETSVLAQGLTRRGFSISRDDASLLANGPLGWPAPPAAPGRRGCSRSTARA